MCCRPYSGDPGPAASIAALTNLTYNKIVMSYIIYYITDDIISYNIMRYNIQYIIYDITYDIT
jgi:hypothetical protein